MLHPQRQYQLFKKHSNDSLLIILLTLPCLVVARHAPRALVATAPAAAAPLVVYVSLPILLPESFLRDRVIVNVHDLLVANTYPHSALAD